MLLSEIDSIERNWKISLSKKSHNTNYGSEEQGISITLVRGGIK
jgi:hypothetical protein